MNRLRFRLINQELISSLFKKHSTHKCNFISRGHGPWFLWAVASQRLLTSYDSNIRGLKPNVFICSQKTDLTLVKNISCLQKQTLLLKKLTVACYFFFFFRQISCRFSSRALNELSQINAALWWLIKLAFAPSALLYFVLLTKDISLLAKPFLIPQ